MEAREDSGEVDPEEGNEDESQAEYGEEGINSGAFSGEHESEVEIEQVY